MKTWTALILLGAVLDPCFGVPWLGQWWHVQPVEWCDRKWNCNKNGSTIVNFRCIFAFGSDKKVVFLPTNFVRINKMDFEAKKAILKQYNTLRNLVAAGLKKRTEEEGGGSMPQATNMRQMTWDKELEDIGDYLVDSSSSRAFINDRVIERDELCRRTSEFQHSTQFNYLDGGYRDKNPKFLSLEEIFNRSFSTSLNNTEISSYHQVEYNPRVKKVDKEPLTMALWAETYRIGCADLLFGSPLIRLAYNATLHYASVNIPANATSSGVEVIKSPFYFRHYICNYGPGSLIVGQSVYKEGKNCSACPKDTKCRPDSVYPNLCASDSDPKGYALGGDPTQSGPSYFVIYILTLILPAVYTNLIISLL